MAAGDIFQNNESILPGHGDEFFFFIEKSFRQTHSRFPQGLAHSVNFLKRELCLINGSFVGGIHPKRFFDDDKTWAKRPASFPLACAVFSAKPRFSPRTAPIPLSGKSIFFKCA